MIYFFFVSDFCLAEPFVYSYTFMSEMNVLFVNTLYLVALALLQHWKKKNPILNILQLFCVNRAIATMSPAAWSLLHYHLKQRWRYVMCL